MMATKRKKSDPVPPEAIAAARQRAAQTRRQLRAKPGPSELLTPEELADAAPYYLVLRAFIRQLKQARTDRGLTLADLSDRTGIAVETLSRLETGVLTNPTWKTLATYAAGLGLRPRVELEANGKQTDSPTRPGRSAPHGR